MNAPQVQYDSNATSPTRVTERALLSRVTIMTTDGRPVASGQASIEAPESPAWTATVHGLDRPGVVASLFFGEGTRDVTLRLADGRGARARIAGTSFTPGNQRVCDLTGIEPLT
jgi:hypothetical protein